MLCTHTKYSKYTFTKKEKCSIPVLEGECSCPAPGELFLLCHMVVILLYSQGKYLCLKKQKEKNKKQKPKKQKKKEKSKKS